jgi:hypothetical protein
VKFYIQGLFENLYTIILRQWCNKRTITYVCWTFSIVANYINTKFQKQSVFETPCL